MGVDPHLLRTFVAVARRGSFSAAARDLGYTQSAVSQHIAALEHDLGAVLLRRRPVEPTGAGRRLLEHAGPLLRRLDAARADIARLTAAPTGRLDVAVAPLALTAAVAGALAGLRRAAPGVAVTVGVLGRAAACAEVATGAVDVGLVDGAAAPDDPLPLPDVGPLSTVAVAAQPLAVAVPHGHPLAGRTGLRLPDLGDARWIDAPDAAVALPQLRAVTGTDGYRGALRYPGTDVCGLLTLVAGGHGLAVLPEPVAAAAAGVTAVPVAAPRLVHRVELLHGSALSEPARRFAAAVQDRPRPAGDELPPDR